MVTNYPLVYQFKTPKGYYIYDTNRNAILAVHENVYNYLLNNKENLYDDESTESESVEDIKYMIENGFLSKKRVNRLEHPATNYLEDILDNKLQTLTLQMTQQCNLRCNYCVYSGSYITRKHSDKIININMAKRGIDFLVSHSQNSKVLNIGFYGGEPLLEFDFIKECIEYAKTKAEGKKLTFNITTNATLLTKKIVEYLAKNEVDLMISLDGPKEIHDLNRRFASNGKGTFDIVVRKMEMIINEFPEFYNKVHFNAVVDPRIDFSCINQFFTNYELLKDSFVNTNFISTDNLNYEKNKELLDIKYRDKYSYEVFKVFLSKLGRLEGKYTSKMALEKFESIKATMFSMRNFFQELPDIMHHGGVCIPGIRKLFMNIEGNFYPCEKCSETSEVMKIGNINDGFDLEKVEKLLNIGELSEKQCKDCWAIRLCGICAVSISDNNELSIQKKSERCKIIKRNTHVMLLEYCMLKEFGYDFDGFNMISFNEVRGNV